MPKRLMNFNFQPEQMRSPLLLCWLGYFLAMGRNSYGQTIVNIVSAIKENQLSDEWLTATSVRIDKNQHDSIASIRRNYSIAENNWMKLLQSKKDTWAKFPDSLQMPFGKLRIPDTIRVLVGHS